MFGRQRSFFFFVFFVLFFRLVSTQRDYLFFLAIRYDSQARVVMTVNVQPCTTLKKKSILLFSDMEAAQIETRHTIG